MATFLRAQGVGSSWQVYHRGWGGGKPWGTTEASGRGFIEKMTKEKREMILKFKLVWKTRSFEQPISDRILFKKCLIQHFFFFFQKGYCDTTPI